MGRSIELNLRFEAGTIYSTRGMLSYDVASILDSLHTMLNFFSESLFSVSLCEYMFIH